MGTMCYEQQVCADECCHDLDFGIPYCCSRYTGLIYLSLMVGGGIIIAILVISCYICMRRTERELEAAAKLEAAKAANNVRNGQVIDTSQVTQETDLNSQQGSTFDLLPPAYNEVMHTLTRCHSYDITSSTQTVDLVSSLVRQFSEGSHATLQALPVLVDVQELIARHRREHGSHVQEMELPPVISQGCLDNKLPSYEECTSCDSAASSRDLPRDDEANRQVNDLLSKFNLNFNVKPEQGLSNSSKQVGQQNRYYDVNPALDNQNCYYDVNPGLDNQNRYYDVNPGLDNQDGYYDVNPGLDNQDGYYDVDPGLDHQNCYYDVNPGLDNQNCCYDVNPGLENINANKNIDQQNHYYDVNPKLGNQNNYYDVNPGLDNQNGYYDVNPGLDNQDGYYDVDPGLDHQNCYYDVNPGLDNQNCCYDVNPGLENINANKNIEQQNHYYDVNPKLGNQNNYYDDVGHMISTVVDSSHRIANIDNKKVNLETRDSNTPCIGTEGCNVVVTETRDCHVAVTETSAYNVAVTEMSNCNVASTETSECNVESQRQVPVM